MRHDGAQSLVVAVGLIALAGCAGLADTSGGEGGLALMAESPAGPPAFVVVDLSQPLEPGIPVFPGGTPFTATTTATMDQGYYSREFAMGEHTGTHVDAPGHFVAGQGLLDSLAPGDLVAPLVVIDVHRQCAADPDFVLDQETLAAWEREHGPVPAGAVVALATGWERRWRDPDRYRNTGTDGVMHFPGYSPEVAEFLAAKRGVRALGIDTLSTDPGASTTFAQHKTFLAHGTYQIENLRNLDQVPATGATVIVGVLPIVDGSGGPARVLAIVPAP